MFTMIIRKVKDNNEEYRRQKAAMTLRKPLIDAGVAAFASQEDPPEPDILKTEDWPKLDARTFKTIRTRSSCFIADVDKASPLLQDETLISDFVTILKTDYLGRPAGAVVLKRVTSKAELYYFSTFATAQLDGAISFKKPPKQALPRMPFLGVGESVVVNLLMAFAKGLAGEAGKGIGAQLVSAIFPQGTQINYKELLDDLSGVIKDANKEQTINEQGGKINGILEDINSYYLERKSRATKEELYAYLLSRHSSLYESLGILRQDEFLKKGIATFVSGAQVDFTLYQEMAIEDPQVDDPRRSSNIESLKKAVNEAVTYVTKTVHTIINDSVNARASMISEPYDDPWCDIGVHKDLWFYFDSKTHKRYGPYEQCGKKDNPRARCQKDRDIYCDSVRTATTNEITGKLQWMLDNAELWKKLLQKPLGSSEERPVARHALVA